MAAVINLDTVRLLRNIEDKPSPQSVSAEIILFPGIRYERWESDTDGVADAELESTCEKRALSRD